MAASSILLAFVISCVAMTMFTTALDINSGFLIGNSADDGSFSLKVVDKVHSLIHCHELKFSDDGAVGAVGSSPFKVMKSKGASTMFLVLYVMKLNFLVRSH